MDKNHEGISVKQIVSGRQHMYVSNLIGFEVFTTKESKEALDAAADRILNIEHDVDGNNINKMWEVIQAFFNIICVSLDALVVIVGAVWVDSG